MAESYGFTPRLEALFNTLRRKRLGGQSYDPRIVKDFAEGAYEAAIAKNLARRKLAEDKEYREKVLADTQAGRAETLALQAEETEEARKDAETGNMINSLLKGASLIPSFFSDGGKSETPIGQSKLSKAGDLFKRSLGGAVPGTETGGVTGENNVMPASAPVTETAVPGIGTKAPADIYNNQTSLTNPGGVPAIGAPVDGKTQTGMTKGYEDTDIAKNINAAEPGSVAGSTQAGAEAGTADYSVPAYEAPPAFQEFTPDAYVPPTFDPYKQKTYAELGGDNAYHAAGGKYSDPQEDKNLWATYQNQQEAKKYDTWVNSQKAASQAAYNNWLTEERARYDTAKEAYEADVARGKSAYDKAVSGAKDAAASATGESGSPWAFNKGRLGGMTPVDEYYGHQYTPAEEPGYNLLPSAFDPTGYFNKGGSAPSYYGKEAVNFSPVSEYKPSVGEKLSYFTDGAPFYKNENIYTPKQELFTSYESPYNYSSYYAKDNEPFNYEPGIYGNNEAFNYEPGIYESFTPDAPPVAQSYAQQPTTRVSAGISSRGIPTVSFSKIVCTELNRQGHLPDEILAKDSECRQKYIPFNVYTGYLTLFGPVVALMRRSKIFTNIVRPFGVATAREMASRVDPNIRGNWLGKTILKIGVPLCGAVGNVVLTALKTAVQMTEVHNG